MNRQLIKARSRHTLLLAAVAATIMSVPTQAFAQTVAPPRPAPAAVKPRPAPQPQPVQAAPQTTLGMASAKTASGDVIARVGDINVSADDIRGYLAALGGRERMALSQNPALLGQAVRMLLANRLVLQELQAKKWDRQPNVAAQLDRVRDSALVELYLEAASMPPANFPSEEDLQKVYEANRDALVMPRQFQLAQIFVPSPKDADKAVDDKARKAVDDLQRKLKVPGADFAAIALEAGEANGGSIGWVAENQVRPEIRSQVMGMAKSTISEPIRLDDGWHILKLVDTKASYTRTLPEVREQLIQQMRAERAKVLRQGYLAELLKQHPPVVNEFALSNLIDKPAL